MVKDLITNDREKDFKNVDSYIPKKGIRGKYFRFWLKENRYQTRFKTSNR